MFCKVAKPKSKKFLLWNESPLIGLWTLKSQNLRFILSQCRTGCHTPHVNKSSGVINNETRGHKVGNTRRKKCHRWAIIIHLVHPARNIRIRNRARSPARTSRLSGGSGCWVQQMELSRFHLTHLLNSAKLSATGAWAYCQGIIIISCWVIYARAPSSPRQLNSSGFHQISRNMTSSQQIKGNLAVIFSIEAPVKG